MGILKAGRLRFQLLFGIKRFHTKTTRPWKLGKHLIKILCCQNSKEQFESARATRESPQPIAGWSTEMPCIIMPSKMHHTKQKQLTSWESKGTSTSPMPPLPRSKNGFWPTVLTLNERRCKSLGLFFSACEEKKHIRKQINGQPKNCQESLRVKRAYFEEYVPLLYKFNPFHWEGPMILRAKKIVTSFEASLILRIKRTNKSKLHFLERTPRYSRPFAQSHSQGSCILRMRGLGGNWSLVDGTVPTNWFIRTLD